MDSSRRDFLKLAAMASVGFVGLRQFGLSEASSSSGTTEGYGPLLPDPKGIINLPKDFTYKIISRSGQKMSDGFLVPARPDGMAAFAGPGGKLILIRNHENNPAPFTDGPFGTNNELLKKLDKTKLYDYGKGKYPALGGTTTLVYNLKTQKVEVEYLSLAGTVRNCAGGPTPWNTWITCEEDVSPPGDKLEKYHGYNFEVPASHIPRLTTPVPLKEMGRFNHEAVAVDPNTSIVYQTEDRADGLIYRFIPNQPKQLAKGGKLQALALKDQKSLDTRNWESLPSPKITVGQELDVEWIDLTHVDAPADTLRYRGYKSGAARFARGEGMWYGKNEIYFACTNGGFKSQGQVFKYIPSQYEGQPDEKKAPGKLVLFSEPNNSAILKSCDNLTVAPWGDVVLCEDDAHPFVVGITPEGKIYKIAENIGYESEFAGGVFSPDGSTYFVNIQGAGLTLAIAGPWTKNT